MIWLRTFFIGTAFLIILLAVLGFIWFILPLVILALIVIGAYAGVYLILKSSIPR